MKDKCSACFKNIETDNGCYSTPSGLFCVLCYEENEFLKYKRLACQAIPSPKKNLSSEEKSIEVNAGFQL
ncbi:MAG: hypothetical protein HRT88_21760 [Lentisphaeraceae bacterium]|nr:hypothetical protein [Lentisphaeraceae bacterium]